MKYGEMLDAADLSDKARELEESGQYRVLRRLPDLPGQILSNVETRMGLYIDCEATGTDTAVDEVTELAAIPFRFTLDGRHVEAMKPLHWYNEPSRPITEEITKLTGISLDTVRGHRIDIAHLDAVLDVTDIVIAHSAQYDRQMLERITPKAKAKCWGCSMTQVPWGTATRKLEWILSTMGYFYDAHGAVEDTRAGLFALTQPLGMPRDATEREIALAGGAEFMTGLQHVLEAGRKTTYHVWATRAPFEVKDLLKARKYNWDADKKTWHKEEVQDYQGEQEWLAKNIYRSLTGTTPARFDKVTAFDRFSKRA